MEQQFSTDDEGKDVVTHDGTTIGTVERVSGDVAHVKPDTGIGGAIRDLLGWTDPNEEVFELHHNRVESIDSQVHLKEGL
jgi:hypothetical protein